MLNSIITPHFTLRDALYLPTWNREANESDGLDDTVRVNLLTLFTQMEKVRDLFNSPVNVHVTYRPEAYNTLVKGAKDSAHKYGMACDFDVSGVSCDDARALLEPHLESLGMRMERLPKGSPWVHLDTRTPLAGHPRYFQP